MLKGKRSLAGRSVMVTGGAGFIGSHLCDRIMQENPSKLAVLDNFSLGKMRNVGPLGRNPKVKIFRRDGRNFSAMERVLKDQGVEIVFNLAVIPLPMSLELPMETVMTNVAITTNLCELLRK